MKPWEKPDYQAEMNAFAALPLPWEALAGRRLLIAGAGGMVGSYLIDAVMTHNALGGAPCGILALGRSGEKAKERFARWWDSPHFCFLRQDINEPLPETVPAADYVIHAAGNTHPLAYATDPIGTLLTNVQGTDHLLRYAVRAKSRRFLFLSSVEIYGENRGEGAAFSEEDCGYLDCNTLRAGYPEGKRAGEALCQAYRAAEGLDSLVVRLPRLYGPTLLPTDSKALSQFLHRGAAREAILLKSEGRQFYSYCYVGDAVAALLLLLAKGVCGEAYNVADAGSDITLRELAALVAAEAGCEVCYEAPGETERRGYSRATRAVLSGKKLAALGWRPRETLPSGIRRTLRLLRED